MRASNIRLILMGLAVIASLPSFLSAQTPAPLAGNYTGTLQAGEAQLHLVLHLTKSVDGAYHASLDSLDQGVYAIGATSTSITGSTLKLEVASVAAHFEGKISADHRTIDGTWSQGSASLPLLFHRQAAGAAARKPSEAVFPVEGLWQSALETHGMRLRFQLHLSHDTEDQLIGALDSLDQGVSGLPAINLQLKEAAFHFEIPSLAGTFEGTLDPSKNKLSGNWSQTGADAKLEFVRSDQPLELRRPQNPSKPYPYHEEEISFSNAVAGVSLAGTLTLPKGPGPFPAALLLVGSGPHDRDEALANHRPFLVLADHLTKKGIAVLRYDKRGIGKSTGSSDRATTLDLAADAQAALAYLKSRKEIDPARIALIGHSEGAMIAPLVAAQSKDVAWVVLLAAPATKGEDTLLNQSELIGRAGGLTDEQLTASLDFDQAAYDLVRTEKDSAALNEKLNGLVKASGLAAAMTPAVLEPQLRMMESLWFRFFLDYDPLPNLKALQVPVLALYGQKDLQVPAKPNLALLKQALQDGGNKDADVRELPELNHLFQHAYSGTPAEYAAIEETFSPEALQIVSAWLLHHSSN
ncbi:MAG: alpha/beta hydrolase family protein [Candidatus Acidiferrales bacterium]